MRYVSLVVSVIFVLFLITSCSEDENGEEPPPPTTGSVSGTVTFAGTPPEGESEIQVSLFSTEQPTGPPGHYSEPFQEVTGAVSYTIPGVSFGEYKLVAVGWERPDSPPGTQEQILGTYSGSVTVSEEQPDVTEVDITADYALLTLD